MRLFQLRRSRTRRRWARRGGRAALRVALGFRTTVGGNRHRRAGDGTNAVRYATGGGCLHWSRALGEEPGLELFYTDKGPGIYDLERALRDGVSTGGSLGHGLRRDAPPARRVRRLLDRKGTTRRLTAARRTTYGTALLGRKWVAPATTEEQRTRAPGAPHRLSGAARARARIERRRLLHHGARRRDAARRRGRARPRARRAGGGARRARHARSTGTASRSRVLPLHARGSARDARRGDGRGHARPRARVFHLRGRGQHRGARARLVRTRRAPSPRTARSARACRRCASGRTAGRRAPRSCSLPTASARRGTSAATPACRKSPQLLAGVLLRDFARNSDDATVLVYQ